MNTHWISGDPPEAPFKAVIFISEKSDQLEGYQEMDDHLMDEVRSMPGFLGYSSQGDGTRSIFISYWKDDTSIAAWRDRRDHLSAKTWAKKGWYRYYHSMVCEVNSSVIFAP